MPLRINEKQYTHLRLKHYTMCKYLVNILYSYLYVIVIIKLCKLN